MSIFLLTLIAAVVIFFFGWLWHGPLFGKYWGMAVTNMSAAELKTMKHSMKSMVWPMVINFIMNILMAFALLLMFANFGVSNAGQAFITAAVFFVGFVLPVLAVAIVWNGRSAKARWTMFLISFGYQLISFVILTVLFLLLG